MVEITFPESKSGTDSELFPLITLAATRGHFVRVSGDTATLDLPSPVRDRSFTLDTIKAIVAAGGNVKGHQMVVEVTNAGDSLVPGSDEKWSDQATLDIGARKFVASDQVGADGKMLAALTLPVLSVPEYRALLPQESE